MGDILNRRLPLCRSCLQSCLYAQHHGPSEPDLDFLFCSTGASRSVWCARQPNSQTRQPNKTDKRVETASTRENGTDLNHAIVTLHLLVRDKLEDRNHCSAEDKWNSKRSDNLSEKECEQTTRFDQHRNQTTGERADSLCSQTGTNNH